MNDGRFYWLKLKRDFFKRHDIRILEHTPYGKDALVVYLKLLLSSTASNGLVNCKEVAEITEEPAVVLDVAIRLLEELELIRRVGSYYVMKDVDEKNIVVSSEEDGRDRNTTEYKKWRMSVYERDDFTCQRCHQKGCRLEAHHVVPWVESRELRFSIDNGITLCEECHKLVHKIIREMNKSGH